MALAMAMLAVAIEPARAQSLPDQVSLHGFGSWAYRRTNTNEYLGGLPKGSYRHVDFALNVAAVVQASLTIHGQVFFAEGEEGELAAVDYAFAEWRFSDAARLRAGKMQLPFGIYAELFDVGTIRPFSSLPQAMYGPAGFISEGSEGIGLRGAIPAGKRWELRYDLYAGGLNVPEDNFAIDVAQGLPQVEEAEEGEITRDVVGARLTLQTPVPGLRVGGSGYTGVNVSDGAPRKVVVGAHAEYLSDRWWVRSEVVHKSESQGAERVTAAYVEVARFLTRRWQVAALYDRVQNRLPNNPSPLRPDFLKHREFAVGLNYWFTPEFVLKGSYAFITGNRFALDPGEDPASSDPKTRLLQLGADFSF